MLIFPRFGCHRYPSIVRLSLLLLYLLRPVQHLTTHFLSVPLFLLSESAGVILLTVPKNLIVDLCNFRVDTQPFRADRVPLVNYLPSWCFFSTARRTEPLQNASFRSWQSGTASSPALRPPRRPGRRRAPPKNGPPAAAAAKREGQEGEQGGRRSTPGVGGGHTPVTPAGRSLATPSTCSSRATR